MAEFVSTTLPTSTYSDPLKAQSIKALEQRYKDMLAQQPGITPENTQTPIQGFGHLANQLGDSFRQGRVDQAAAAQRQMLAQTMAGMDPNNPQPHEIAAINSADPEMAKQMLQTLAESRRQRDLFAQQNKSQTQLFSHQDATAKEAARVAREAKIDEEQRLANRPASDAAKITQDVQAGKLTPQQGDALIKKLSSAPASEQKYVTGMQEQSIAGQSLIASLDEAIALTNHPKGIHAGGGAGFAQGIGENAPKFLQGVTSAAGIDPETTSNTQRYNQIMGAQALDLLNQMKGASSDRDVQVNFKIVNDPSATIENKRKAIEALKIKLNGLLQVHHNAITEAGGKVPTLPTAGGPTATPPGGGGGASTAAPQLSPQDAEALTWANANSNDPRAAEIKKRLGK